MIVLTTFSAELYPFHKRHLQSNIVLVLGTLFQVRMDHFSWKFGPQTTFPLDQISVQVNICSHEYCKSVRG